MVKLRLGRSRGAYGMGKNEELYLKRIKITVTADNGLTALYERDIDGKRNRS